MRPKGPRDPVTGPESGPEKPFPIKLSGPVIKGFGRGSRELGIPTANIPPSGLAQYPNLESGVYYGFVALLMTEDTMQKADNMALILSGSASSSSSATTTAAGVSGVGVDGTKGEEGAKKEEGKGQPMPDKGNDATSLNTTRGEEGEKKTKKKEKMKEEEREAGQESDGKASTATIYPAVLSIGYNPYYKNETRSIEIHVLHHFPHHNFYTTPLNLLILGFIRPEYDYSSLDALIDDIRTDCDVARTSLKRGAYAKYEGDGDGWLTDFTWAEGLKEGDVRSVEESVVGAASAGAGAGAGKDEGKL